MDDNRILALFSTSYAKARDKFLETACERGLTVDSYDLDLPGAEGERLATDVVLDGPDDATKLLIVIGGVHGVEGYPGSAIQTGMLSLGDPASLGADDDTAILHVHAVNPYGYSHSRRATQENVDLNRNFVDFAAPLPVNPGYAEIHDLLLPSEWPPRPETEGQLDAFREREGQRGFQRAVSQGQHAFRDGLHFGGFEPTWSNRTFRAILRRYASRCRHIGSVDIHTGLGPYGHGERIFACFEDREDPFVSERASRWWGKLTSVHTGTSTSVPMAGPIQSALYDECSQATKTNICLEYGTLPLPDMLRAMRAEHWLHRFGTGDQAKADTIKQGLRDAFYPAVPNWNLEIWRQGREACVQALCGLRAMN